MEHRAALPRKAFLLSLVTQCQLLNEVLAQRGAVPEPGENIEALLGRLPRPRSALEEFIGRCALAKTLVGDRGLGLMDGRRDRAARRRAVEYCLSALRTDSAAAWPGSTELLDLVRLLSPVDAHATDEARLAADVRRVAVTKYRENLTDTRIASAVGASRAEMARAFKRVYGQSVRDFMSDLRFAHARRLLRWTALKISAVAAEVGYRSPKDLYRLIKSRTGLTPAGLRRLERRSSAARRPSATARGAPRVVESPNDL